MESRTTGSRMSMSPLDKSLACQRVKNFLHNSIIGRKEFVGRRVGTKGRPR